MRVQGPSVAGGVRDGHDQDIDGAISELERKSTFQRLNVVDACLGLTSGSPTVEADDGVPCSAITRDRRSGPPCPASVRRQLRAEPFEQPKLRGISSRVSIRVHTDGEAQTDHLRRPARLVERQLADASLDPAPLRVRHSGAPAGGRLAQPALSRARRSSAPISRAMREAPTSAFVDPARSWQPLTEHDRRRLRVTHRNNACLLLAEQAVSRFTAGLDPPQPLTCSRCSNSRPIARQASRDGRRPP